MSNFKIGERVQVNTDAGWRSGMVDNRTVDRHGTLYVVSLDSGGVVYVRDTDLASAAGRVKSLRQKYSKAMSSNGYDIRLGDLVSWRDSGPEGSGRWLEGTVTGVDSATVEIELDNGDVYIVQPRSVSVSARETRGPR